MNLLMAFFGALVGGWFGWWLGTRAGGATAAVMALAGAAIGAYGGWRLYALYLRPTPPRHAGKNKKKKTARK
jgi:hypothetical protein